MFLCPAIFVGSSTPPTTVTLDGDGTEIPDYASFTWTWSVSPDSGDAGDIYVDGEYQATGTSGSYTTTLGVGSHSSYVIVDGVQSNTIIIFDLASPTSVYLSGDGGTFLTGDSFTPTWTVDSGSDSGTITFDGTPTGYDESSGLYDLGPMTLGSHTVYVTMDSGQTPTSNTITITVYDPVVLTAPTDGSSINDGDNVAFSWTGGSGSGSVYVNYVQVATLSSGGSAVVSYDAIGSSSGNTVFVYVIDDAGYTSDAISVSLN